MSENNTDRELMIQLIKREIHAQVKPVLIADDELSMRLFVTEVLEEADPSLQVYQATDGQEALEVLAKIRGKYKCDPLFIVTDLEMPGMDGWHLIEALRKDYVKAGKSHGIPIIVLSASSSERRTLLKRFTISGESCRYSPLVAVAKEDCINPEKYDTQGRGGLLSWIEHFLENE